MSKTLLEFRDAHCHLHELGEDFLQSFLQRLQGGGFRAAVCGTNPDDWDAVESLWRRFPEVVVPHIGIHPWFAGAAKKEHFDELERRLKINPTLQLGEIGLDKCKGGLLKCPFNEQVEVFEKQLSLGTDRVTSVHCVRAFDELFEIVKKHSARKFILHAFAPSNAGTISKFEGLENCYFSVGGNFRFVKNASIIRRIPENRLLIETDCPSLCPSLEKLRETPDLLQMASCEFRDAIERNEATRNEPATLRWIAKQIDDIKNNDETLKITATNFDKLFS